MHPANRCPQQAHPKHKKAQAEQHADVRRSGQCRRSTTGLCAYASLKNPKIVTTIHGGSGRLRYNASVNSVNEVAIRESSTVDSTQPRYDKTRVFLNGGYVEIQFVGIVRQAALRRVLAEVDRLTDELTRLSLAMHAGSYTVHRLVQAVVHHFLLSDQTALDGE